MAEALDGYDTLGRQNPAFEQVAPGMLGMISEQRQELALFRQETNAHLQGIDAKLQQLSASEESRVNAATAAKGIRDAIPGMMQQMLQAAAALEGAVSAVAHPAYLPSPSLQVPAESPQQPPAPSTTVPNQVEAQTGGLLDASSFVHVRPPALDGCKSISDLYNEFMGTGNYLDKPVPGGYAELDNQFKAKWRRHFSKADDGHYSRVRAIMTGIKNRMKDGESLQDALDWMQRLFGDKDGCKSSISNLKLVLQDKGLVPKGKPRAKKRRLETQESVAGV